VDWRPFSARLFSRFADTLPLGRPANTEMKSGKPEESRKEVLSWNQQR